MDIKTAILVDEGNAEHDLRAQHKRLSNTEPPNQKEFYHLVSGSTAEQSSSVLSAQGGPQEKCAEGRGAWLTQTPSPGEEEEARG